jgi:hypothetical protein
MSLKFAALGCLTVLSALRTPARADDQAQNLGPVGPHEGDVPLLDIRGNLCYAERDRPAFVG